MGLHQLRLANLSTNRAGCYGQILSLVAKRQNR